MGGKG
jgi:hypothetical protein